MICLLLEEAAIHTARVIFAAIGCAFLFLAGCGFAGPAWRGNSKPRASLALLGAACLALAAELPLIAS